MDIIERNAKCARDLLEAAAEIKRLRAALAHAESMLSEHVEQYHDYEDPPHEPSERKGLVAIQHHIMGSLMDDTAQQGSQGETK